MKKQPEITEATRKALIDAFCRLNREKPIEKITIRELAARAGYNRCTFYQYFTDIYAVLEHIEDEVAGRVRENFERIITQEAFGQTFFEAVTKIQTEQATYFDLLLRPANRARFAEKLAKDVRPVFMERFHLPMGNPGAEYLVDMYFATVLAALGDWVNEGRKMPVEELSRLIGGVLTHGVMTEISKLKTCFLSIDWHKK